ncbi:sigma-70 family RNA polymerase sigma factor [Nannocystaceae bacterium ST9]
MTTTETSWTELAEPLRRFLRSRVGDPDVAEDLLQEVFLRLHERRDRIAELERIDAWLFRVARNVAIDHLRRRGRESGEPASEPSETPTIADDDQAARVLATWLAGRVDALPERYREAIVLTEQQGLSQRAAAERLGLPYSTLKSRVQRGRDRLHAELLHCCEVELDARRRVTDFRPRGNPCDCGPACDPKRDEVD